MKRGSLRALYIRELRKSHDAEIRLTNALPAMIQAASSIALRRVLEHHLEQTKDHATRLEMILNVLNEPLERERCRGMESLIGEVQRSTRSVQRRNDSSSLPGRRPISPDPTEALSATQLSLKQLLTPHMRSTATFSLRYMLCWMEFAPRFPDSVD